MGLSNENPNPSTATVDDYIAAIDIRHAQNLANRLIKYEHNPDPREAPDPSKGIRIRRPRILVPVGRIEVSAECADHNSRVSGVGSPDAFERLWKGRS